MQRIFLLIFCVTPCLSLNILGLFPHSGKSHFDVFAPLLRELATRGHNLTVIGHFPLKHPISGYTDISLKGNTDILFSFIDLDDLPKGRRMYYYTPFMLSEFAKETCKGLQTKQMQHFAKNEQKFDLIIMETFNSDCFLGFAHKYKIPFIGLSSCTIMPWSNSRFGNPVNPSYIPVNLVPFSDRMNFLERVENTVYYLYSEIVYHYFIDTPGYLEAKNYFGDDLPPFSDIAKNTSLILVNSHFSLNLPRPLVPNVIEVGGMFLGKPKKLPQGSSQEEFLSFKTCEGLQTPFRHVSFHCQEFNVPYFPKFLHFSPLSILLFLLIYSKDTLKLMTPHSRIFGVFKFLVPYQENTIRKYKQQNSKYPMNYYNKIK